MSGLELIQGIALTFFIAISLTALTLISASRGLQPSRKVVTLTALTCIGIYWTVSLTVWIASHLTPPT